MKWQCWLQIHPPLRHDQIFTYLRNLRGHIHCALQCLSCPQSNILEWVGLIMARPMYALLTTSPFWLPTDPRPLAIYYLPLTQIIDSQEAPILNIAGQPTFVSQPTTGRAEQAMINGCFSRARNNGYCIRIYNRQCITSLMTTSTMPLRYQMIQISSDGIWQWNSAIFLTRS